MPAARPSSIKCKRAGCRLPCYRPIQTRAIFIIMVKRYATSAICGRPPCQQNSRDRSFPMHVQACGFDKIHRESEDNEPPGGTFTFVPRYFHTTPLGYSRLLFPNKLCRPFAIKSSSNVRLAAGRKRRGANSPKYPKFVTCCLQIEIVDNRVTVR